MWVERLTSPLMYGVLTSDSEVWYYRGQMGKDTLCPQVAFCYGCNRLIDISKIEDNECPLCGAYKYFEPMGFDGIWCVLENFGKRLKKLEKKHLSRLIR